MRRGKDFLEHLGGKLCNHRHVHPSKVFCHKLNCLLLNIFVQNQICLGAVCWCRLEVQIALDERVCLVVKRPNVKMIGQML